MKSPVFNREGQPDLAQNLLLLFPKYTAKPLMKFFASLPKGSHLLNLQSHFTIDLFMTSRQNRRVASHMCSSFSGAEIRPQPMNTDTTSFW